LDEASGHSGSWEHPGRGAAELSAGGGGARRQGAAEHAGKGAAELPAGGGAGCGFMAEK
jgi:hypothetical protein